MKKYLDDGMKFFATCTWKDIGLLKLCLFSLGMVAGMTIPAKRRAIPCLVAAVAFVGSYIPLMARFINFSRNLPEESE